MIKTIAIAQSKNIFKEDAGIVYYGDVVDYEILRRKYITEIPKVIDNAEKLE